MSEIPSEGPNPDVDRHSAFSDEPDSTTDRHSAFAEEGKDKQPPEANPSAQHEPRVPERSKPVDARTQLLEARFPERALDFITKLGVSQADSMKRSFGWPDRSVADPEQFVAHGIYTVINKYRADTLEVGRTVNPDFESLITRMVDGEIRKQLEIPHRTEAFDLLVSEGIPTGPLHASIQLGIRTALERAKGYGWSATRKNEFVDPEMFVAGGINMVISRYRQDSKDGGVDVNPDVEALLRDVVGNAIRTKFRIRIPL